MNVKVTDLYWIAGLMEGEGCFAFNGTPRFLLQMTDEDVVSKFRGLTSPENKIRILAPGTSGRVKTVYYFCISGSRAIEWMMTIYSLLGRRRKEKIREVIQEWKNIATVAEQQQKRKKTLMINKAVRAIAVNRKIPIEEAEKVLNGLMGKTIQ